MRVMPTGIKAPNKWLDRCMFNITCWICTEKCRYKQGIIIPWYNARYYNTLSGVFLL